MAVLRPDKCFHLESQIAGCLGQVQLLLPARLVLPPERILRDCAHDISVTRCHGRALCGLHLCHSDGLSAGWRRMLRGRRRMES
eukprot:7870029-Pyramimonas_sp.AAC.1